MNGKVSKKGMGVYIGSLEIKNKKNFGVLCVYVRVRVRGCYLDRYWVCLMEVKLLLIATGIMTCQGLFRDRHGVGSLKTRARNINAPSLKHARGWSIYVFF